MWCGSVVGCLLNIHKVLAYTLSTKHTAQMFTRGKDQGHSLTERTMFWCERHYRLTWTYQEELDCVQVISKFPSAVIWPFIYFSFEIWYIIMVCDHYHIIWKFHILHFLKIWRKFALNEKNNVNTCSIYVNILSNNVWKKCWFNLVKRNVDMFNISPY